MKILSLCITASGQQKEIYLKVLEEGMYVCMDGCSVRPSKYLTVWVVALVGWFNLVQYPSVYLPRCVSTDHHHHHCTVTHWCTVCHGIRTGTASLVRYRENNLSKLPFLLPVQVSMDATHRGGQVPHRPVRAVWCEARVYKNWTHWLRAAESVFTLTGAHPHHTYIQYIFKRPLTPAVGVVPGIIRLASYPRTLSEIPTCFEDWRLVRNGDKIQYVFHAAARKTPSTRTSRVTSGSWGVDRWGSLPSDGQEGNLNTKLPPACCALTLLLPPPPTW